MRSVKERMNAVFRYRMREEMKQYKVSVETNIENVRTKNEDNIFCNGVYKEKEEKIFIYKCFLSADVLNVVGVFDGMGGYSNGDEAYYLAVRQLKKSLDIVREESSSFDAEVVLSKINT